MQSHFLITELPARGSGTQAIWSQGPARRLVVFVHGFGGKAIETWHTFQLKPTLEKEFSGIDFVFWGYDGLHTRSVVSATALCDFINDLLNNPLSIINPSLPAEDARKHFEYTDIFVVAHSLGAIVARQALLVAFARKDAWAVVTKLVLFAPAHRGAHVLALVSEWLLGKPLVGFFVPLAQMLGWFGVLEDVRKTSDTVKDLKTETETWRGRGYGAAVDAVLVVHASGDRVVGPERFGEDEPSVFEARAGHSTVCKPTLLYPAPVEHLRKALR